MQWIYALELALLLALMWRVGSYLGHIAHELHRRNEEGEDDD